SREIGILSFLGAYFIALREDMQHLSMEDFDVATIPQDSHEVLIPIKGDQRHGNRDGRRGKGEELEYPFFEGDGSSFDEWEDYGVADDNYKEAPVFDDDQYEEVIEEEEGFVDSYLNF
nr:hypothetical protein [Tanacetum cinerariifolium]GEX57563.1 hypothetical protein [Tanacetum cinerariifolium]